MIAMRENRTLSLLRAGKPAIGTWLQLHNPPAARLLAAQGLLDWMLVDFEHTPVDLGTAATILGSIADVSGGRVTPLARVATGSAAAIKHALDAGAQGVIVPMVRTVQEVREAAAYARFPPLGERGAGGLLPHLGFGISRPEYVRRANEQTLFGVQIETREAVDDVERILDVPGVDLCFIGPNDLHLALGCPAKFWSDEPAFVRAVARVREACKVRRIPLGTLCKDAASAKARIEDGFTFVGLGSDAHFMLTYCGMQAGELRGLPDPGSWCDRVDFER
ncbi:2,4-dihydroxyhept-2-ene-1,7-dioic acid aldolase [Minicystis rosea]|nr:2,4-dihydroxyhept-2-ene-1,7-dioic acid aldolase [Minicystis rosea]